MTEDELNKLFAQNTDASSPQTTDAKRKTMDLAMAEFNRIHHTNSAQKKIENTSQGIWHWLRLMVNSKINHEEHAMKNQKKWLYSSVVTASLAVFGVILVNNNPYILSPDGISEDQAGAEFIDKKQKEPVLISDRSTKAKPLSTEAEEMLVTGTNQTTKEIALADMPQAEDAYSSAPSKPAVQLEKKHAVRLASSNLATSQMVASKIRVADMPIVQPSQHRDDFESVSTNPIKLVSAEPVSTFSIDVDTASYSFVRRQLNNGALPVKDAVRIEEMVNYFDYDYPLPSNKSQPFKPTVVVSDSPWASGKKLIHIGIKGYDIEKTAKPKSNLVFLLDVSGSMNNPDKLPLVKQSMNLLLSQLNPTDTVAIVVYAGAAGTVLEPTHVKDKPKIMAALSKLNAGGSTAGAQGIQLAYELAEHNFDKNAVNRIILATDGDFNVGINDRETLQGFIERKRDKGIFLSILGFGQGNYQDHLMQTLAQNGNGVATYIDTLSEAQKVLVNESTSTLFPIAKDVKIQVEFNPATVAEYRLIGYETRALKREDFNNDKVDAGDIGAGHSVTAIYEITPTQSDAKLIDDLRYGKNIIKTKMAESSEYGFLKLRYKLPNEDTSQLMEHAISGQNTYSSNDDKNTVLLREVNFATAVAAFAQQMKDPKYLNNWSLQQTLDLAQANKGDDNYGYRTEFVQLVRKAMIADDMKN